MPNNKINPEIVRSLHQALAGSEISSGSPSAQAPQPSAPVVPPSGGSTTGSLFQALANYLKPSSTPNVDPYQNFANKATGRNSN